MEGFIGAVGQYWRGHIVAPEEFDARLFKREEFGQWVDCFGLAQDQNAARSERKGEPAEREPLQFGCEIDQHIPAEHQIDAGEGCAMTEIMFTENDQGANSLADLEAAIVTVKMALD